MPADSWSTVLLLGDTDEAIEMIGRLARTKRGREIFKRLALSTRRRITALLVEAANV